MPAAIDQHIAILCNPLAGVGKAITLARQIAGELSKRQVSHELIIDNWPVAFTMFTDVWITGGDGTLNYFINHYPGIQLPLVIFKGGTGNDFHWLLYGNKTLEEQLQVALQGYPKPIDIGKCNDRYFINGAGIGFEGEVARALTGKKKMPGKTSFFITILKKIFGYRCKDYTIQSAEYNNTGKKLLIDISNGRRAGGGFHIAPEARADDGLFDVVIAGALTTLQRLRYLPVIEKGKHLQLNVITHFHTQKISIASPLPVQYHLDGEYYTAAKIEIEMIPSGLLFRY
ncbi:MAG: YegS/Rv2252/BmrU family lipid kinase [Chitinophagales bacterium]|nr:YegS/Rv2252/BmrU family lipid kinase [Chitinophagales bacterium]